jgi:hypothetical protein
MKLTNNPTKIVALVSYGNVCKKANLGSKKGSQRCASFTFIHTAKHKGKEEDVYEINHVTYFNSHDDFKDVYPGICCKELGLDKEMLSFLRFGTNYFTREQADRILEDRKKAGMALEEEEMEGNLKPSFADASDQEELGETASLVK